MFKVHLIRETNPWSRFDIHKIILENNGESIWEKKFPDLNLFNNEGAQGALDLFKEICEVRYDLRPCNISESKATAIMMGIYD
jgi:hypothetical protein